MADHRSSNKGRSNRDGGSRGDGKNKRPGGRSGWSKDGKGSGRAKDGKGSGWSRDGKGSNRGGKRGQPSKGPYKPKGKSKPHQGAYRSQDPNEPVIPAGVTADELDEDARAALHTLSGANQEIVARHLVAAGQMLDIDAEAAYRHAQAAVKRAGRVDVVREAAALTAYASGRYEEALREVRAVRRMRGDTSLRAIEADCERGLGRPERAIEIIDQTDTAEMNLADQVELMLVAAGARADLDQLEYSLMIVDNALEALPEEVPEDLVRRLLELKVERLGDLGRVEEAAELVKTMPAEVDPMEIVDLGTLLVADVDNVRTDLRGGEQPLNKMFDGALLDLDGVCYAGSQVIEGGPAALGEAADAGMQLGYLTNNSSRSPQSVADKLEGLGYEAEANQVMTSAMDMVADLKEALEPGSKILVTGSAELADLVREGGFEVVVSADDEPIAVVQGLSPDLTWKDLTEAALAIQRGAAFYATNLDPKLPMERGFAIGNGSLVAAVSNATGVRPTAAGKPGAKIFTRGAEMLHIDRPIVVGDQLSTDIAGAVAARMPSMHVLTGVSNARDVVQAQRGQRPSFVSIGLEGLNQTHPRPRHHRDGTWSCGVSQLVSIDRRGKITVGGVTLNGAGNPVSLNLDTYRALVAAAWELDDERVRIGCPELLIVPNEDSSGIVTEPNDLIEVLVEAADADTPEAGVVKEVVAEEGEGTAADTAIEPAVDTTEEPASQATGKTSTEAVEAPAQPTEMEG